VHALGVVGPGSGSSKTSEYSDSYFQMAQQDYDTEKLQHGTEQVCRSPEGEAESSTYRIEHNYSACVSTHESALCYWL